MRRKNIAGLTALCLLLSALLCGCGPSAEYTVAFDGNSDAGLTIPSQTVTSGQTIAAPEAPEREGYTFLGWFQDAGLTQPWDTGSGKVVSDMTLYAGWDRDTGAALTVRLYGASGKTIQLFAENNAVLFSSLREYTRP